MSSIALEDSFSDESLFIQGDNAASESSATTSSTTTRSGEKRKRNSTVRAPEIWKLSRARLPSELGFKDCNRVWYCKQLSCNPPHKTWSTNVTSNARNHLRKVHDLYTTEKESLVQRATSMSIIESLKKAEGEKERRDQLKTDMILASLIKKDN